MKVGTLRVDFTPSALKPNVMKTENRQPATRKTHQSNPFMIKPRSGFLLSSFIFHHSSFVFCLLSFVICLYSMSYLTMNAYCRETFGKKLYKLALDGGFTCPTRDGTLDTRGCVFCSAAGAGEFAGRGATPDEQIEDAKRRVAAKCGAGCGYIAYFQSFTNTYAPAEKLRALYEPVIRREDISVLSIATRPDCLPPETLDLLAELNKTKPVWVELGLQTTKPESVEYIRRGYPNGVFAKAVKALRETGIYVIVHIILGLPGETPEDMENTLRFALECGANGVKFQLLHVLEGTDLAEDWRAGRFETLSLKEYTDILARLVPLLPPDVAVHRLTGDGSKKDLLSPLWSGEKKRVLNAIRTRLGDER